MLWGIPHALGTKSGHLLPCPHLQLTCLLQGCAHLVMQEHLRSRKATHLLPTQAAGTLTLRARISRLQSSVGFPSGGHPNKLQLGEQFLAGPQRHVLRPGLPTPNGWLTQVPLTPKRGCGAHPSGTVWSPPGPGSSPGPWVTHLQPTPPGPGPGPGRPRGRRVTHLRPTPLGPGPGPGHSRQPRVTHLC